MRAFSVGLVAAISLSSLFYQTDAAPTPYTRIDSKHLWQYVREQADIAERYRDQGHPQFWVRIAGTSSDLEDVQWLLTKYRQAGLTGTHSQNVAFFDPQWVPESWEVTATDAGKTVTLTSAQPPCGAVSTEGRSWICLRVCRAGQ